MTWDESKHKRGQPENAGQFGPGGGGASTQTADARKPKAQEGVAAKDGHGDVGRPESAIRWYTGDGYSHINAVLRGKAEHSEETRKATIAIHKEIKEKGDLGGQITVHRAMNVQDPEGFTRQFTPGRQVSMKGFVSTSKTRQTARFGGQGAVLVEIETSRGLDLNKHGYSDEPTEQEVLLGHNWTYEVVSVGVTKHKAGYSWPTVKLRVVSDKVSGKPDISVEKKARSSEDEELVPMKMK